MSIPKPLITVAAACALAAFGATIEAQERIDYEAIAKIRKEGREHSQIMKTMHFLTDVYGPRLTGSPNHKAAAEYVMKTTTSWGFENAHLEPWDFGHPGWLNERFSGFITSPVKDSLVGEALAWTPGTNGVAKGRAVRIDPPACAPANPNPAAAAPGRPGAGPGGGGAPAAPPKCPTLEEVNAALDKLKTTVKGAIVLVGKPTKVAVTLEPPATRGGELARDRRRCGPRVAEG